MHPVQRFNIQGRIYTYVNNTLQFSSEPMRQLSMSLPMTNVSTHRFDYVASTALYSEICSQQRSYFSVLEQVAQASRLQQQLRLFLQDEENPSFNNSVSEFPRHHTEDWKLFSHSFLRLLLTVTDTFLNFILTLRTLLTYVWTIRLSYLAMCNLCNRLRPLAQAFRVWTTTRFHQLRQHITRHFSRPTSRENPDSATTTACPA